MMAWNLTRSDTVYRHGSFSAGMKAAGYEVRTDAPQGKPGNLLLAWNRYGATHELATRFEAAGGIVVVAENGYLAPGGLSPHDQKDRQWYALARHDHNGRGWTPEGPGTRWDALGIDLKPWRADGDHIVIAPNRPFGRPETMMPPTWAADTAKRLAKLTNRPIVVRPHPGNSPPVKPLAEDLARAWCTVIWSSSAGVHSLIAGVPVICCAPAWICKTATYDGLEFVQTENPAQDIDRLPALQRLAWAQWSLGEIEDGTAFRALLA